MELLSSIQNSAFSVWVRQSGSLFAYPSFLFLHTIGLGMVVGISAMLDLRLLGVARRLPIAPLARFIPIMWIGFWINAVSGTVLLMIDATTKMTNPVFGIKMGLIAIAVTDTVLINRRIVRKPAVDEASVSTEAKALAAISLSCWVGAIAAGRLMAYLGSGSGVPGLTNTIGG
jgi:hypothetical protein